MVNYIVSYEGTKKEGRGGVKTSEDRILIDESVFAFSLCLPPPFLASLFLSLLPFFSPSLPLFSPSLSHISPHSLLSSPSTPLFLPLLFPSQSLIFLTLPSISVCLSYFLFLSVSYLLFPFLSLSLVVSPFFSLSLCLSLSVSRYIFTITDNFRKVPLTSIRGVTSKVLYVDW